MKIKDKREKLHLTQSSIANSVGIQLRSYQKIENYEVIPRVNNAIKIAKILNCSVEDLWDSSGK